jgi:hypothetical protein
VISAAVAVLLAAATVPQWEPRHRLDVGFSAMTSAPERFSLVAGLHPWRGIELDLGMGFDSGRVSLSSHGFYRWLFLTPGRQRDRGLEVGLGPGVGVRGARFCGVAACAHAIGPELLLSVEATLWFNRTLGVFLQADGGLAVEWAEALPGFFQAGVRLPARVLAGISF